jgi:hypothetical protein
VKLINTEGLALFGPGSEWLWTALQFIALATTFVAIFRQLRTQQVELRHQTKLLRSQAHFNALALSQRAREVLVENEGFANVMTTAFATPETLSDGDWLRCSVYMFMQFNQWEYLYYQHRDGSIPTEYWVGAEAYYRGLVAEKPGYARFWSESHIGFDEPFHAYVANEFAAKPTPAVAEG